MKILAFLLLCAAAVQIYARGVYPNGCPKDWTIRKLLPHENCNQFYQCLAGRLIVRTCPPLFYFNVNNSRCEWRAKPNCDRDTPDDDDQSDENNGDNPNEDTGNSNPSDAPSICAKVDSDGVLVAHEKCNKYYICANGKPVAQRCPANLFFNPRIDECDWPDNVECKNRVIAHSDEDNKEDQDDKVSDDISKDFVETRNSISSVTIISVCAATNSSGKLFAHERCNKFYICVHGKPLAQICPANLFFNPKKNQCDWPKNVDCSGRFIPCFEEDTNDVVGNVGAGNFNPNKAPSICAKVGSDGVLVAHNQCNKYYICVHGKPLAQRCPANLFFNPNIDECDWPNNVGHRGRVVPGFGEDFQHDQDVNGNSGQVGAGNSNPSQAPSICAKVGSDGVLVAHRQCNRYYICVHGKPVAQSCPANLFFNPRKDECDWPENVPCRGRVVSDFGEDFQDDQDVKSSSGKVGAGNSNPNQAPSICAKVGSDGVLVAHRQCNRYYICVHGKPVAQSCPANLFFNPRKDECDWPENVRCRGRVVSDFGEDFQDDQDMKSSSGKVGAGNSNPNQAPSICAKVGSDGVLVAHRQCNRYYICVHGKPVVQSCPANLFFNPRIDECDWPKNVLCRSS